MNEKVYINSLHAWQTYVCQQGLGWHTQAGRIVPWFSYPHNNEGTTSAGHESALRWAIERRLVRPSAKLLRQLGI